MPKKQTDSKTTDDSVRKSRDIIAREVNELKEVLAEAKAMRRIDVLEDMLDIMNEQ